MHLFEQDPGLDLPTYIFDNYGHQALEAVNDWRSQGATHEDALRELITRFSRIPRVAGVSVFPVEPGQ